MKAIALTQKKKKKFRRIGRVDKADFPEFDLSDVNIKIDTGAYTSVLHCTNIVVNPKTGIEFNVPIGNEVRQMLVKNYALKTIKSSNGIEEQRYIITTRITLFDKTHRIKMSLTDRSDMRYPVLIGRNLLKKNFLVDVSKKNLSYKKKIKRSQ